LGDGAIVDSSYAAKHHLTVGSRLTIESSNGTTRQLNVAGTYARRKLNRCSRTS
jgi:hypothetical protein